jgi:predicted phosphodiesterase
MEIETIGPHLVVISGDLVDSPTLENLSQAKAFLDYLEARQHLVLVAPGNHDRHGEIDLNRWLTHLRLTRGPYDCQLIKLTDEFYLTVLLLDSTIAKQTNFIYQLAEDVLQVRGWVDKEQLAWIEMMVSELRAKHETEFSNSTKIVVLHHHPLPSHHATYNEPFLILANAAEFFEKLKAFRPDFILHGHQHDPIIQIIAREDDFKEVAVLGAGATIRKSDKDEEKLPLVSSQTTFYSISLERSYSDVTTYAYANALPFQRKFVPTKTVRRIKQRKELLLNEIELLWQIHFPSTDLIVTEKRTIERASGSDEVKEFQYWVGNTVCPGMKSPTIEELGVSAKRCYETKVTTLEVSRCAVSESQNVEGIAYKCFELKFNLSPGLAKGLSRDTINISYRWPQAFWEFRNQNTLQDSICFPEPITKFSLEVEFVGEKRLKRMTMLPLATNNRDSLLVFDNRTGYQRVESVETDIAARRWKYVKYDIPALANITYCISRE